MDESDDNAQITQILTMRRATWQRLVKLAEGLAADAVILSPAELGTIALEFGIERMENTPRKRKT